MEARRPERLLKYGSQSLWGQNRKKKNIAKSELIGFGACVAKETKNNKNKKIHQQLFI